MSGRKAMRVKSILLAVAGVIAIAIAGAAIVLATFDADRYRPEIAAAFAAATARELTLGGPIKLAISLTPAIELRDVKVANAPWDSRLDMVRVARVAVAAELLPLLSGQICVTKVSVEGLDVLLETNAKGEPNWLLGGAP
ncbi:MAG: AsmA family protein, partial [Alphaproteobacteria bacterium]|nr:AsmA family protein [Alphaproteobacteria bacterium]